MLIFFFLKMAQGLIYYDPAEREDPEWVLRLKLDQYPTPRIE
jgi:hypothetical protein